MKTDVPLNEEQIVARGRELSEAKWHLPPRYRLTEELIALPPDEFKKRDPQMFNLWQKVLEDEKRLAASAAMPFEQMSSQDTYRARAAQRAEEHRATIVNLDPQIGQALTTGEGDVAELQAAKLAIRTRRVEQLALLGRFDLAAQETPDPRLRDHYLAILDAVWRDDEGDGSWCECGDVHGSGEHANLTVSQQYIAEEVFSLKHGKVMPLLRCGGCGTLNVAALPDHVRELRSHRVKALQTAGHLSPDDAAKKLVSVGHTGARLLK